jgi:DNA end-binding protein Ku
MAARSIGSCTISFGLVSIPVKIFSTGQASESISFRMLHKKCASPLKQQYICPKDGEVVERDNVVKGYEFAKDQYVLFSPEELKALEEEPTKAVAIAEFVPIDKVDPIYFDKPYYLGPDRGGERAYRLLSEAMRKTGVSGLGQYASRGKQYLVMLRAVEGGLVMQQLRYAEEVRPFSEVPIPGKADIKDAELKLALQLMEQNITAEFRPESYKDTVRGRMQEVIQQKVEGQEVTIAPGETPQAQIIDLMEALKQSLGQAPAGAKPARATAAKSERKPAKASPRQVEKKTSESGANRSGRKASK